MSIGRGWYEDHVETEPDEVRELAVVLLKDKLIEIFEKIRNNPDRERMAPKGRNPW